MGKRGALYLPSNNSQQVDAAAKPTSTTANASDTKVDVSTQDPNVMIDNNATRAPQSAPRSATTPSVPSCAIGWGKMITNDAATRPAINPTEHVKSINWSEL